MTWTEPQQWSVGYKPTASDLNNYIKNNLTWVQQRQLFSAHASVSRNYFPTSSSLPPILFDVTDADVGGPSGNGSAHVDGYSWKITQPGWWFFNFITGATLSVVNSNISVALYNTTTATYVTAETRMIPSGSRTMTIQCVGLFNFAVGSSNTVQWLVLGNGAGSGTNITAAIQPADNVTSVPPTFQGYWVRQP